MNYCSKTDTSTVEIEKPNDQTELIEKSKAMQEHILAFKAKMKYFKDNPNLKAGGELYTADSAVLELESLLNMTFCHTSIECTQKIFATSEIIMPLDDIEKINDPKLMEVYYDKVIDTIQAQMGRVDYENMKLLLVDLEYLGNDTDGDAIVSIGALIGNQQQIVLNNDDWWYGEFMGLYPSGQYAPEDAASQLMNRVIDNVLPAPQPGGRWYFTNVVNTYVNPTQDPLHGGNPNNNRDYKIFYKTEVVAPILNINKHLPMSDMDFYENHYIDYAVGFESSCPGKKFSDCIITGNPYWTGNNNTYSIQHDYRIYVGYRYLIMEENVDDILSY